MTKKMSFECKRCGECCCIPVFVKGNGEYDKIARITEIYNIKFTETIRPGFGLTMIPDESLDQERRIAAGEDIKKVCPFLEFDNDNKSSCKIYEDRPTVCKMFGFYPNMRGLGCKKQR